MDEYKFLNSDIWISYTQKRYVPIKDIKYRLEKLGHDTDEWNVLKEQIEKHRSMGMVALPLTTINKNFWYFPSDSIQEKILSISLLGEKIYKTIFDCGTFQEEFLVNATVEEAITSAIYEGANSTRAQAQKIIATNSDPKNKTEWMILNNYRALQLVKKYRKNSIDKKIILEIHETVTKNTLEGDDENFYGKFRNDTVFVGNHTGIVHSSIEKCLDEVCDLITNHQRYIPGLIRGILFHYFLAYIHPFFDGNGRTARSLFYLKAFKHNLNYVELLSISAHLKEHGKKYEKSFALVKDHNLDLTYFIDFSLDSILSALKKVEIKVAFLVSITNLQSDLGLNKNQITLLQKLALNKFHGITSEDFAKSIDRTREMARKGLKQLYNLGLLTERKQGKKLYYYIDNEKLKQSVKPYLT